MYKFVFLINPISGGGQGKIISEFLPEIMNSMGFSDVDWKVEFTHFEKMNEQICDCLNSTETLIAVGGDGTVSAVLSEMLVGEYSKKVKIGLIPLGTGNDLARVLKLYKPFTDKGLLFLVRRLLKAKSIPFDLWKVNEKLAMANYFSCGIDARIAHDFNEDRANGVIASHSVIANKIHYVKRFFADRDYVLKNATIEYSDVNGNNKIINITGHRTVIIGNIPSFASGANPFYKSNMADGLLEMVDVPNMFNFLMSIAVGNIPFFGMLYKKYFLKTIKIRSLKIRVHNDEFLQLDGEDLTHKVPQETIIEYACKVKMLALDE